MPRHPLAEIFGHRYDNHSDTAERDRDRKLCPFRNKTPSCTKSSLKSPLGVCSVLENEEPVITCPVRFTEGWQPLLDARDLVFANDSSENWKWVPEVRLYDRFHQSAGNIDWVLVRLNDAGELVDYGAVEVQSVYISGNVRDPFNRYMEMRPDHDVPWRGQVRPDFLSSSRKRLLPQLLYKGEILRAWGKKTAVILQDRFFRTLPDLDEVSRAEADIVWLTYRMELDEAANEYRLKRDRVVYTSSKETLSRITHAEAGEEAEFIRQVVAKMKRMDSGELSLADLVVDPVSDDESELGDLDE